MIKETLDSLARVFLSEAKVTAVSAPQASFRVFTLQSDRFKGAKLTAGEKVQIRVDTTAMRTYTPYAHDPAAGTFKIVVFLHANSPAASYFGAVSEGATLLLFGPRGSLKLERGPYTLFGDESSFGVAASCTAERSIFEVGSRDAVQPVIDALGLRNVTLVERAANDAHLQVIEAALAEAAGTLVFTGRAKSTQALRAALKKRGKSLSGTLVKAYWADGKVGLD